MKPLILICTVSTIVAAYGANAQTNSSPQASSSTAVSVNADNTRKNRDDVAAPNADQQPNNHTDIDITKRVRQGVMADKSLSTYGHNVKIIAEGGKVTLKGPVRSEGEKSAIGSKAADVVGQDNVVNELRVTSH
jgi:hyperosmotically inducible protein